MASTPEGARREWTVIGGRPDSDQLAGIISPIVRTTDPDLVIVFGSAARATMTPESDVDLVVVKDVANLRELGRRTRECLPRPHPPVDIVPATRALLGNHRESLSWVYGPAMADGIVAYERGRDHTGGSERAWDRIAVDESREQRMVRVFRYQRDETLDWLDKARKDLTVVRSRDADIDPEARCYSAQAATEKSLKALLVTHGRPVRGEHDLAGFAEELRATGEVLPAVATAQELSRLAEYAGAAQYPGWVGETTAADAARFCEIAVQVYGQARERAPQSLQSYEPQARDRARQA